jgi:hypothetical protein
MTEADRLRLEAARALRLSQLIGDKRASEALAAHAANLFERADAMERESAPPAPQVPATPQQPMQQQQQVQQKKEEE